jgi:hypothetical protein
LLIDAEAAQAWVFQGNPPSERVVGEPLGAAA